jgi:hypothetical protein
MAMTPKEIEDLKRELVKRREEELAQAQQKVDVATWALKCAEEDLDAATAVASAAAGVP